MPESVTDRPTKSHEQVFLLSKQPRYFFDQEAVREPQPTADPSHPGYRPSVMGRGSNNFAAHGELAREQNAGGPATGIKNKVLHPAGRNVRSVWEIATQPYPEAHFATFPEALAERCIKAGCPEWVCGTCGKARERRVEIEPTEYKQRQDHPSSTVRHGAPLCFAGGVPKSLHHTTGWSDCGHDNYRPGVVLDPFMGSGTVALVARNQRRHSIGVELNEDYARLCAKRLQQLSLLAEGTM